MYGLKACNLFTHRLWKFFNCYLWRLKIYLHNVKSTEHIPLTLPSYKTSLFKWSSKSQPISSHFTISVQIMQWLRIVKRCPQSCIIFRRQETSGVRELLRGKVDEPMNQCWIYTVLFTQEDYLGLQYTYTWIHVWHLTLHLISLWTIFLERKMENFSQPQMDWDPPISFHIEQVSQTEFETKLQRWKEERERKY